MKMVRGGRRSDMTGNLSGYPPTKNHNYPPMLHSEILQHRTEEGTPFPVRGGDPFIFFAFNSIVNYL